MKGNILVIKGQSLYNVLRIAADCMIEAFRDRGYHVSVVDLTLEEDRLRFNDAMKEKYVLIFSFQALLFDLTLPDKKTSVFRNLKGTPVFGHIVDHPIYHNQRVKTIHGENMFIGCIDRNHVEYIHKYYPGVKNALFLPHGGFMPQRIVPYEKRSIDVYFPGSYKNPAEIQYKIDQMPDVYKNMANLLKSKMLDNKLLTLQTALYEYLDQIKFAYTSEEFTQLMNIMSVVDQYIHEYTRDKLIRYLANGGVKLTVNGSGWDRLDSGLLSNIKVISSEGIDFSGVLELMADSKLILNHVPTLQNGMHERIFTSMLCGAVCLTNDFPIMHEEFCDGESIVLYSDDGLPLFADRIKELLNSPEKAEKIAQNGQKIAKKAHTWANNADTILRIVGLEADTE